MKLLPFYSGLVGMFLLNSQVKFIDADKVVVASFNDGLAPSSGQICSSSDNHQINQVFYYAPSTRNLRHLRSSGSTSNQAAVLNHTYIGNDESALRELGTFSNRCKNACANYVAGTCRAIGCAGYRRALKSEPNEDHERELQTDVCTTVINHIENGLNQLVSTNAISNCCKSFIDASKRKYTCYDDTIYGVLETVKVWNVGDASSPSLIANFEASSLPLSRPYGPFSSHFSVCSSTTITIEATANECVEIVSYWMHKVPEWTHPFHTMDDRSRPFTMYGNDAAGKMIGARLPVGEYILNVKPDWLIGRERKLMFTVNNC